VRVSTTSTYLRAAQGLGGALSRVQDVSQQLASGKRVNRWSDDAPAATSAGRYRAQEADWQSYRRVATDARGWLDTADGALQSMSTALARLTSLATSAVNGALSADAREAIASEVEQLRTEIKDLAQTRHLGRPLFAGFGAQAVTTAPDGTVAWAGDGGRVLRQVSPTITLEVNVDGQELLGFSAGEDVFSTLTSLAAAVRAADAPGLQAGQTALGRAHERVLDGLAKVGTTANRVAAANEAGAVALSDLAARRAELEDVDVAAAVLQLNAAQASYEAALGAAARADLPSLASFLR
jgi:flagellar hook-associated protein 3 FlgL